MTFYFLSGATCSDPGRPPDGSQHATSYEVNQVVTFTCDKAGYTPIPEAIMCVSEGSVQWNDTSTPECKG